jgi:hypothetical protein
MRAAHRLAFGRPGKAGATLVPDMTATAETWRVRSCMANTRRPTKQEARRMLSCEAAGDAHGGDE